MVNIGRPSQGCTLCRKRRIKCDQRKPGCFRCEKFGRQCPGYVKPDKWLFMNQSSKDQVTKNPVITQDRMYDIPTPMAVNVELNARCLFIKSFVASPDPATGSPGHLEFLPQLYLSVGEDSCLKNCLNACALAYMSNFETSSIMKPLMVNAYGKAIRSLNECLAGPNVCLDETLVSVHLMGMYEILTPMFTFGNWKSHVLGTIQLLRMRGINQMQTSIGRQLYRVVLTPIVIGSMRAGETPPQQAISLLRGMNHPDEHRENFPAIAARFFFEVAMFRAETNQMFFFQGQPDPEHLLTFIARGRMLINLAEQQKRENVSEKWNSIEQIHKGQKCYKFRSRWIMAHWVKYWCSELCLYNVLARIAGYKTTAERILDSYDEVYMAPTYVSKACEAADNIISCIPFAFGDAIESDMKQKVQSQETKSVVGVLYIVFGLEAVVQIESTRSDQKMRAGQALKRMGDEFGVLRIYSKRFRRGN